MIASLERLFDYGKHQFGREPAIVTPITV